jgi:glycerol-3-phosphate dehydrogenase
VEDFLSRRSRALLLDAATAAETAPHVAALLAAELGRDEDWCREKVRTFQELARTYLP